MMLSNCVCNDDNRYPDRQCALYSTVQLYTIFYLNTVAAMITVVHTTTSYNPMRCERFLLAITMKSVSHFFLVSQLATHAFYEWTVVSLIMRMSIYFGNSTSM